MYLSKTYNKINVQYFVHTKLFNLYYAYCNNLNLTKIFEYVEMTFINNYHTPSKFEFCLN